MSNKILATMLCSASLVLGGTGTAFAQTQAAMPKTVQDHITKLAGGANAADSCVIATLLPAYYGQIAGTQSALAVGLLDKDSENCGGMAPPETSVVAYTVSGSAYRQIALPSGLAALQVNKILTVAPRQGGFRITVLFRGPHDPMCCASQKASFAVRMPE